MSMLKQTGVMGHPQGCLKTTVKGFVDGPRLLQSFEQVMAVLQEKLSSRFRSVREAFIHYDIDLDGYIGDTEFRTALVLMGFDMTPEEYRRLWRSFDADGDGKISYNEFNNLVGPLIHPRINADLARPMTIPVKKGHARALARGMQQRLGPDVEAAFRELDADRSGYISHQEFVQLLRRVGVVKIDDEDSFSLFKRHQRPDNKTGEMSLDEFKDCVQYCSSLPPSSLVNPSETEALVPPNVEELERLLAERLFTKYSTVQRAFRMMDDSKNGALNADEFRRAFFLMNMPLRDDQFKAVMEQFDPEGTGLVRYHDFCRIIGPLIHPEARDTSRAMLAMEEASGAQSGLVFRPTARLGANVPLSIRTAREHAQLTSSGRLLGDNAPSTAPKLEETTFDVKPDPGKSGRDHFLLSPSSPRSLGTETTSGFAASFKAAASPAAAAAVASAAMAAAAASSSAPERAPSPPRAITAPRVGSASGATVQGGATTLGAGALAGGDDVARIEERMRKALGRDWVHVAADVKSAAGGGRGAALDGESLRDVFAERGVALTSRDVASLAARYAAPGRSASSVDVDAFLSHAFKASFAGAAPPAKGAKAAAVTTRGGTISRFTGTGSRGGTATVGGGASAGPSAFVSSGRVGLF